MLIPVHPKEPNDPAARVNTRIEYLYRDAANYKVHNYIIIPGNFTGNQIDEIIDCLFDECYFVPSKLGLPEKKFDTQTDDDVPMFELDRTWFTPTAETPDTQIAPDELVRRFKLFKNHWLD